MQVRLFNWLGREFVEVAGEGNARMAAAAATEELFGKFEKELQSYGFSMSDAVRVRVWGRDKDARMLATAARSRMLTANRKVASSSFIS